jgi:hypothetical protein
MKKSGLPDLTGLFETMGEFLRDVEVQQHQQGDLMKARAAFTTIVETIYPPPPRVLYPCTGGGPPRIMPMPLSRVAK